MSRFATATESLRQAQTQTTVLSVSSRQILPTMWAGGAPLPSRSVPPLGPMKAVLRAVGAVRATCARAPGGRILGQSHSNNLDVKIDAHECSVSFTENLLQWRQANRCPHTMFNDPLPVVLSTTASSFTQRRDCRRQQRHKMHSLTDPRARGIASHRIRCSHHGNNPSREADRHAALDNPKHGVYGFFAH